MIVKLLTEHHLEFLSLKGDCTGSSESTLVKLPHCWKSHVTAQLCRSSTELVAYAKGFASVPSPIRNKLVKMLVTVEPHGIV